MLTGDYAAEQARWESTPVEVGRPLAKPTPIFAKLDPELGGDRPGVGPDRPVSRTASRERKRRWQSTLPTPFRSQR